MNNYKIRVNNEAESREAQELFFELGYAWLSGCTTTSNMNSPYLYTSEDGGLWCGDYHSTFNECVRKELTLPQLRDLVVLHRNDVKGATHVGKSGSEYYVTNAGEVYFFDGMEWVLEDVDVSNLKPNQKPQLEQGLISGADALRALADGKEVEVRKHKEWNSCDIAKATAVEYFINDYYEFRLKPRTVKLEIEVPAPFEPKVGEQYFHLSIAAIVGYSFDVYDESSYHDAAMVFGAWRTEAEIKIVVEQLRKIKEHSK